MAWLTASPGRTTHSRWEKPSRRRRGHLRCRGQQRRPPARARCGLSDGVRWHELEVHGEGVPSKVGSRFPTHACQPTTSSSPADLHLRSARASPPPGPHHSHPRPPQPRARPQAPLRQLRQGPNLQCCFPRPPRRRHLQLRRRHVAIPAQDGSSGVPTRTLRQAMARWVSGAICLRLCLILNATRSSGKPVDLQDLLLRLTFDNICGLAFGKDPETLAPGLPENSFAIAFDRATEATLHCFIFPEFMWKLKKWLRLGMEVSLSRSLDLHRRPLPLPGHRPSRSWSSPAQAPPSRFMKKGDYSDDFLQHVALNFILTGRDTSSFALIWFFWLVMQNPVVEDKILREIGGVLMETYGTREQVGRRTPRLRGGRPPRLPQGRPLRNRLGVVDVLFEHGLCRRGSWDRGDRI
ncbi:hypothetical protein Taro_049809 [Colocasia esculenta]|uniref:Uncharacterized protein n=1 Tax=Colocasia esculenta TaxID=4460 RepID=A0A843XBS2_COLES|nr:hypothetical protein [Colocasia esculenta]